MKFRIGMLLQTKIDRCACCKRQKRVKFRLYRDESPWQVWNVCYDCFRMDEDKLLRQIGFRGHLVEDRAADKSADSGSGSSEKSETLSPLRIAA